MVLVVHQCLPVVRALLVALFWALCGMVVLVVVATVMAQMLLLTLLTLAQLLTLLIKQTTMYQTLQCRVYSKQVRIMRTSLMP